MAVEFQPFATDVGANVVTIEDYLASVYLQNGFVSGVALPEQANRAWRQSSFVVAAIAQYISTQNGGIDVLDDGDLNGFIAKLTSGISLGASVRPARLVTSSATLVILTSDYALGLNRSAGLSAMDAQLPAGAQVGQSFLIEDIRGNLMNFPVTVLPPSGTIANRSTYVMNEDRQGAEFRLYDVGIWSVRT